MLSAARISVDKQSKHGLNRSVNGLRRGHRPFQKPSHRRPPTFPASNGSGDLDDCFLVDTARLHNLALVTRDAKIVDLASRHPEYLTAIPC